MSDRFIVKPKAEMVVGETWMAWCTDHKEAQRFIREDAPTHTPRHAWSSGWLGSWADALCIVDALDAWHTARVEAPKDEPGCWNCDIASSREVLCLECRKAQEEPKGPTDAEIVEAWDAACREHEGGRSGPWFIGTEWTSRGKLAAVYVGPKNAPVRVTADEHQAARSRELKRKQTDARDKERHRVICEDQYEP